MILRWGGPDCRFVLVEFKSKGVKFLLELGESLRQGLGVSVEGEGILVNVHSRVWVRVSHLVFRRWTRFGEQVAGKMWLDMKHPCASPLSHGVSDDLFFTEFAREFVPRLEQEFAPHPEILVGGFNLILDGAPFHGALRVLDVDAGHGSVFVFGDWRCGRRWALSVSRFFLHGDRGPLSLRVPRDHTAHTTRTAEHD